LGKITAPTLIVWGDQDAFCPRRDQDLLIAAIADSRLLIYPGAGHDPQWEEPERFAHDVVTFIAQQLKERDNRRCGEVMADDV
jgi:pimeloyl-ACP methyl ester carboxylesterase